MYEEWGLGRGSGEQGEERGRWARGRVLRGGGEGGGGGVIGSNIQLKVLRPGA